MSVHVDHLNSSIRKLLLITYKNRKQKIQKMKSKSQHGAKVLEELDLIHQAQQNRPDKMPMPTRQVPSGNATKEPSVSRKQRRAFSFRKWRVLRVLPELLRQSSRCLVCLQVYQIRNLPLSMNGKAVIVGWRTKGWEGEETLPVHVWEGVATFDEIFLHYCNIKMPCAMKSFTMWVSLIDAKESDLGTFTLNLSELMAGGTSNPKFSGKAMSFNLCGIGAEATLGVSFYYTIIEADSPSLHPMACNSLIGHNQNKRRWCSCLPDLKSRKNKSLAGSTRRVTSLESDIGFITIENSKESPCQIGIDDDEGFITIEKGIVRTTSWRPPSDNTSHSEDGIDEYTTIKENPCVWSDDYEESDVDRVENEFLRMLEEKRLEKEECEIMSEPWEKEIRELEEKLNLEISFDVGLNMVLKAAENELLKATQVYKSRVGARAMEKAEYEALVKKWRVGKRAVEATSCVETFGGFGSPI